MAMDIYIYAMGVVGLVLLLLAFVLNVLKKIERNGYAYDGMNFIGAVLLAVYALFAQIWLFFILEAVWAAAALLFIFERSTHRRIRGIAGWDSIGETRDLRTISAARKPKKKVVKRKKKKEKEEPVLPWFQ